MNAMLERMLIAYAAQMGISLSDAQAEQFARYHEMLTEANARFNLTRVPDDLREAADRNYLDCMAPVAAGALELRALPEKRMPWRVFGCTAAVCALAQCLSLLGA